MSLQLLKGYFVIFYGFFLFFVYFLLPRDALAWGPGAHMTYALHALAHLTLLAPPIRALLKKHRNAFLYGTIAADIILGKKFAGELYHCHNWDVAFSLLKKAKKARERAFILGYLGHLAVDTVAHNYYVPYKIILSYETLTLRHTYWEMRFDEKMDPEVWRVLEEIAGGDYLDLDRFLENNLKRTIFSFSTNKKIFNSLLIIQRMKKWRLASALLARRSSYPLLEKDVHHFRDLCFEVLVEFLQGPEQARVLKADPAGQLKLLFAKEMVRDLRRYTRRRVMGRNETKHFIQEIREKLSEGLYKPIDLPLITDAISAA